MPNRDWVATTDPTPLLAHLLTRASARKARLFACAYLRCVWGELDGREAAREAVRVAERFADGDATPAELKRAEGADDDRDWGALPVLADALEEAGCADRTILDHLRGAGPHVPGCWCLDAILAKG